MSPRRNRSRSRSRGGDSSTLVKRLALSIAIIGIAAFLIVPSDAFTTAVSPRSAEVGAATGENALLGLDPAEEIESTESGGSSVSQGGCGVGPLVVTQGGSTTLHTISGGTVDRYGPPSQASQVQAIGPLRADLDVPDDSRAEIPYITSATGPTAIRVMDTDGQSQRILNDPSFEQGSLPTQKTLLATGQFAVEQARDDDEDKHGDGGEEDRNGDGEEEEDDGGGSGPGRQKLITITNNLGENANIDVELTRRSGASLVVDGDVIEGGEYYRFTSVGVGKTEEVRVTAPSETTDIEVKIAAQTVGGSMTVKKTLTIDVVRSTSSGGSNAKPDTDGVDSYIFFVDANHDKIYRTEHTGSRAEVVVDPGNGAQAVLGVSDIDGDSAGELIFADGSQHVRYIEPRGNIRKLTNGGQVRIMGLGSDVRQTLIMMKQQAYRL